MTLTLFASSYVSVILFRAYLIGITIFPTRHEERGERRNIVGSGGR
jgi:hypothetical protein